MLRHFCLGIAAVLGLAALANGIFMLYTPLDWYFAVPGVTTTGPFNQHFLRDIGLIFVFIGAAFLMGIAQPAYRVALADGTELITSSDHRFLSDDGWKHVLNNPRGHRGRPHLTTNNRLVGTGAFASGSLARALYRRGACQFFRRSWKTASGRRRRVTSWW